MQRSALFTVSAVLLTSLAQAIRLSQDTSVTTTTEESPAAEQDLTIVAELPVPDLETAEEPEADNNPSGLPGYIPGNPNTADFDFDNQDAGQGSMFEDPLNNPEYNAVSVQKIQDAMQTPSLQTQLEEELSSHDWGQDLIINDGSTHTTESSATSTTTSTGGACDLSCCMPMPNCCGCGDTQTHTTQDEVVAHEAASHLANMALGGAVEETEDLTVEQATEVQKALESEIFDALIPEIESDPDLVEELPSTVIEAEEAAAQDQESAIEFAQTKAALLQQLH